MNYEPPSGETEIPEIGYYYAGPFWYSGDWIKNLILFFDGIGLLVPAYRREELWSFDPAITAGLEEHGLLYVFEPETFVDEAASVKLAEAMREVIVSGAFDNLPRDEREFEEISTSRMPVRALGVTDSAEFVFEHLKEQGLAFPADNSFPIGKEYEDEDLRGAFIIHPTVRSLVLALLAQILRPYGTKMGLELSPVTDRLDVIRTLESLLSEPFMPSAGDVISFDLETVGIDLSSIPVEEILTFRQEHHSEYKLYVRKVRKYVRELSLMSEEQRREALEDRKAEIADTAHDLRQLPPKAWKRAGAFALTIAGAAWTISTGDVMGPLLSGVGGVLGIGSEGSVRTEAGSYSYLFQANQKGMSR